MVNFKWILAILLLMIIQLILELAAKKISNKICKSKDKPGYQLHLAGAMIFSKYLLLVDSDLMVYKIPQANYAAATTKNSSRSMRLNVTGSYIEKYCPGLKTDSNWKRIKSFYKNIYHVIDNTKKHIYVYIMVPDHGIGICINLVTKKLCPGLGTASGSFPKQTIIDDHDHIYNIIVNSGTLALSTVKYTYAPDGTVSTGHGIPTGHLYYAVDASRKSKNVTIISGSYDYVVTPENDPLKNSSSWRSENITDWYITGDGGGQVKYPPVGYLYNGHFYLYGLEGVILFADKVLGYEEQLNTSYPPGTVIASTAVVMIPYSKFFKCDKVARAPVSKYSSTLKHQPEATTRTTTTTEKPPGLGHRLISSLVMAFLVILVACGVYWCCLTEKDKKEMRTVDAKDKEARSGHHAQVKGSKADESPSPGPGLASKKISTKKQSLVVSGARSSSKQS